MERQTQILSVAITCQMIDLEAVEKELQERNRGNDNSGQGSPGTKIVSGRFVWKLVCSSDFVRPFLFALKSWYWCRLCPQSRGELLKTEETDVYFRKISFLEVDWKRKENI